MQTCYAINYALPIPLHQMSLIEVPSSLSHHQCLFKVTVQGEEIDDTLLLAPG